jgi:hypothetical protein
MDSFVIVVSLVTLAVGSYLVWPSRWNVPAHLQLGFCLIAYVIPALIGVQDAFSPELRRFDARLLGLGAACYAAGLVIGFRVTLPDAAWERAVLWRRLPRQPFERLVWRRGVWLMVLSLLGLFVSFRLMGFVPAFARNPFMAKFFRGAYAASYHRVALLLRPCEVIVTTLIPIAFMLCYLRRSVAAFALALGGVVGLAMLLTRGPLAIGGLTFLGVLAARKRSWFTAYLAVVILIYPIGSGFYHLLGLQRAGVHANLWNIIAAGVPDITDQLHFFSAYLAHPVMTYGKTFWGGLIPWHYRWNPSVFSLTVEGGNINKIASGGLRLAAPQWGYVAFGWPGAAVVSLLSGVIWGYATRWLKRATDPRAPLRNIVALTTYTTLWVGVASFYWLTLYELPVVATAVLLAYPVALSRRDARHVSGAGRGAPAEGARGARSPFPAAVGTQPP